MFHTLARLKLLKFMLIGAFSAGIVATILAKEMRKKKKTEDLDEQTNLSDVSQGNDQ